MSRYMQIDIRLVPFYEKRFEKQFPHIADLLRRMSYKDLVEEEVSLYEMADAIEAIAENPDTPTALRDAVAPYAERIMGLKEAAREHLLARRLNELDQLLYRLEDGFEDMEAAL